MVKISGPPSSAIRNEPISGDLASVLQQAAAAAAIDEIIIVSGGQPAKADGTRRTGSTRHDHGRAADIQLLQNRRLLTFTDKSAPNAILVFVETAAACGATGIGAGLSYMGNKTIHVGFGSSPQDSRELVWGAGGRSTHAPAWLETAARKGWAERGQSHMAVGSSTPAGRFRVLARHGLRLRRGPSADFPAETTLACGTIVYVAGYEGDPPWARVALANDGQLDGYCLAAFLSPETLPDR